MSFWLTIGLGAALASAAFLASMLGIGGGVLYTPLQVIFGVEVHEAAATSQLLIVVLSVGATHVYCRAGKVDWALAAFLELFTATGAFAGGYLSGFLSERVLLTVLAAVVVVAGLSMMRRRLPEGDWRHARHSWYKWRRRSCGVEYELNLLAAIPVSFAAGTIAGMVGIGGGVLKVPMMVLLFGIPMEVAVATSALMVGITAIGGFAGHFVQGHFDWRMAVPLAPAVFVAAQLGAHTMLRIDRARLKRIFGIAMFLVALAIVLRMTNWGGG